MTDKRADWAERERLMHQAITHQQPKDNMDLADWQSLLSETNMELQRYMRNLASSGGPASLGADFEVCGECHGTGRTGFQGVRECTNCEGAGVIQPHVPGDRLQALETLQRTRQQLARMSALCWRIDRWINEQMESEEPQPDEEMIIRSDPTPEPHVVISHRWIDTAPETILREVVDEFLPEWEIGEIEPLKDTPRLTYIAHDTHWSRIFDVICQKFGARWETLEGNPPRIIVLGGTD